MPRRSNAQADLSALMDSSNVYDKDNVYLSDQGWAYRHFKGDGSSYYDEILVAGEVPVGDSPDAFGTASPTFLVGDGVQAPLAGKTFIGDLLTGGSGYTATASGVATTGGSGTGLTVDITVESGEVLDVDLAAAGSGYTDGDVLTVNDGAGTGATFTILID